jgi:predicted 3-demethylubiquinone-9 3-methyltransferase (glyoxalase superfamily)
MNKIIPNLWLDGQAEELANFYTSVFKNSQLGNTVYYTEAGKEIHGHEPGEVVTVDFEIEGMHLVVLNGGSLFKVNPSISFFVRCRTAEEVDGLWSKLSEGGQALMDLGEYPFSKKYGWLKDKYGVSWQLNFTEEDFDQKISASLLFTQDKAGKAEEAMKFYASVFPDSKVGTISRYGAGQEPDKEGTVNYGEFTVLGDQMLAMDSARSHDFSFSEGVSLMVECKDQAEIDEYWGKLSAVPESEICGWLKDKYGVSWQIVPEVMAKMIKEGSPEQIERLTASYMKMGKFDIAELERAYNQR